MCSFLRCFIERASNLQAEILALLIWLRLTLQQHDRRRQLNSTLPLYTTGQSTLPKQLPVIKSLSQSYCCYRRCLNNLSYLNLSNSHKQYLSYAHCAPV